jgi:tripartite-type tricarboxylate transporter receptor subunit TctC
MKFPRRRFLKLAIGITALTAVSRIGRAQPYPSRPITIVLPFAAGGPTDTLSRIVAEGMKASLGQPVIIENVTGAAGTIGVGRVVRAAPDGYTLSVDTMTGLTPTTSLFSTPKPRRGCVWQI